MSRRHRYRRPHRHRDHPYRGVLVLAAILAVFFSLLFLTARISGRSDPAPWQHPSPSYPSPPYPSPTYPGPSPR